MLNFEAGWSFRRIKRIDSTDTSAQNAVGGRTWSSCSDEWYAIDDNDVLILLNQNRDIVKKNLLLLIATVIKTV